MTIDDDDPLDLLWLTRGDINLDVDSDGDEFVKSLSHTQFTKLLWQAHERGGPRVGHSVYNRRHANGDYIGFGGPAADRLIKAPAPSTPSTEPGGGSSAHRRSQ